MKNTLAIAFNAGAYGTYLEWVLNNLVTKDSISSPFTAVGNSHRSRFGHHLNDMDGLARYSESTLNYPTIRLHPKTHKQHNLQKNLDEILRAVSHLVLLYPSRDHELFCVCNYMTKVWPDQHCFDGPMSHANIDDIRNRWPTDNIKDMRTMPVWIQREHMSLDLFNSWRDQVEWYLPDIWHHPRALIVTTGDLLYDFESTMIKIMQYWGKDLSRSLKELIPYHDEMLSLQIHKDKDKTCESILKSVLDNFDAWHWGDLCLISQAWIQHRLRIMGYELRCHELNHFPQDTLSLKALIYKA